MTAALYVRISKDPEGRAEGVAVQEERGRQYAAEHWPGVPVAIYSDNDISAANGAHRPGFEQMIAAVRRGEITEVVCAEQSRLTRQPAEWEGLVVILAKAGIERVHCYRGGVVDVAGSRLVGRILSAVDAEEVERLRQRVNDKLSSLAAQGRPLGKPPFGYRATVDGDGRAALEVVPTEAEVVSETAHRVLTGWSLSAIARDLDARGIPTRQRGAWSHSNVRGMLTTPIVAGLSVRGGETRPGTWEPILDQTTWRTLVARLSGPKHRPARKYLLSGIAVCGRCGHGLTGRYAKGRSGMRHLYFCHPSVGGCGRLGINAEPVERYVVAELLDALDSPEFAAAMSDDEHEARRTELVAELEGIEAQHVELAKRWANGELPAAAWDQARAALDERKRRAQQELAAVPAPPAAVNLTSLRSDWSNMTTDEGRTVLDLFIERIEVAPASPGAKSVDLGRVSITWK
jgi:site-specific DNA recombinase